MDKNIILFSNHLGQKKNGFETTASCFNKFLKFRNKKVIRPHITNCLFKNLENLYNINSSISERKINIGGDHSMAISTVANSLNTNKGQKLILV